MGPIELAALSAPVISDRLVVLQFKIFAWPGLTPSVPAEAMPFSRMHQVSPDPFPDPVFNLPKTHTRISDTKIR